MSTKKALLYGISLILYCLTSNGQSSDKNYIKTTSLLTPITDASQIEILEDGEKIDVIQYYDGLGRLVQTNNYHASPSFSDIIQHIEYDSLGRQRYDFLPFPIEADGSYRSAARDLVMEYYNSPTDMTIPATPYPFGEKEFDNSPLNRVMKQGFPGASWQLDAHPQRFGYFSNSWNDHVFLFDYNESTHQFSTNGYYSEHTLFVNKTYDENGNLTRTFRDKANKIILREEPSTEPITSMIFMITFRWSSSRKAAARSRVHLQAPHRLSTCGALHSHTITATGSPKNTSRA